MARMSHKNLMHIRTTREFSAPVGYTLEQRYTMPCRLLVMVSWSSALPWHTGFVLSAPHGYQSTKLLMRVCSCCDYVIPTIQYLDLSPNHNILTFMWGANVYMCLHAYFVLAL